MPKMRSSDVRLTRIVVIIISISSSCIELVVFTDVPTMTGYSNQPAFHTLYNALFSRVGRLRGTEGVPPELGVNMQ